MSVHKYNIRFTRRAKSDLANMLAFTAQKWGNKQLAEYQKKIADALGMIADNPQLGRKKYGIMVYTVGRHMIFYRVENDTIYVLRILHEHMDSLRHL